MDSFYKQNILPHLRQILSHSELGKLGKKGVKRQEIKKGKTDLNLLCPSI
jgi:hypothetical protein